jgi:hypothetical protein
MLSTLSVEAFAIGGAIAALLFALCWRWLMAVPLMVAMLVIACATDAMIGARVVLAGVRRCLTKTSR